MREYVQRRACGRGAYVCCCLLFVGCGAYVSGCASEYNVGTHSQDRIFYSSASEASMGSSIHQAIIKEIAISYNPKDITRISTIGDRIVSVCDRQELTYYFYVIDDPKTKDELNAFSTPGGYVYIYKKFLDMLDENQLAFVVAHEISHIVSRHSLKRMQGATGAGLAMLASIFVPGGNPEFTQGLQLGLGQVLMAYSRQDEFNADELAIKYTKALGYDARAGIAVMEKLYAENKKDIRPISYFRTHPYTGERIAHMKKILQLPLAPEDYANQM